MPKLLIPYRLHISYKSYLDEIVTLEPIVVIILATLLQAILIFLFEKQIS